MIVQTSANDTHFVITQVDHAVASAKLAQQFGNQQFAPLNPAELIQHVVAHHDDGWRDLDKRWLQDPNTGLPYHLVKTPLDKLVRTGTGSPDANETHHPLCGLISSMHTYGLYHGRYGLSNFVFIDLMPETLQPYVTQMLANELVRQRRLKGQLPPEWSAESFLFHNYKLLQFFDTLALYFQTTHAEARQEATFENVPRAIGDDVTVTIRPKSPTEYTLTAWPFSAETIQFSTRGRYLTPQPPNSDLAALAANTPTTMQTATLTHV
jgi:hypothetical protein